MNITPLFEQIEHLRHPDKGCPWDQKQTLDSYAKPLIGEAEELVEALAAGDLGHVREEAGDLLWNLCFVIRLGEEAGAFTRQQVMADILAKMERRHPHVFGEVEANTPEEALAAFKAAKAQERK